MFTTSFRALAGIRARLAAAVVLGALAVSAPAADAQSSHFAFSFTGIGGAHVGSGLITTSNVLNTKGGFDILSVSGVFDGATITGLRNNPNQPEFEATAIFTYNNVLFPGAGMFFDRYGIAFETTAQTVNIFDGIADGFPPEITPENPYGLILVSNAGAASSSVGVFNVREVPEPATWALLPLAFGAMGLVRRRRA